MKREIVKINRDKCNGCGVCVPNCHEGALQIIDNKAVLVSELMCDGLGACLGHCPEDAITIEVREAAPYDESLVMQDMIKHGKNTIVAHLKHLKEHNQTTFLKQGVTFLRNNEAKLDFDLKTVIEEVHGLKIQPIQTIQNHGHHHGGGVCLGSREIVIERNNSTDNETVSEIKSELKQWPVQMHLINPLASYFINSNLVLAADCVAFSIGNFHQKYLKNNSLVIACPKLDSGLESYMDKLVRLIDDAKVNTISIMRMEVPCCFGLTQIVKNAAKKASRKVPLKEIVVGIDGEIRSENWL